MIVRCSKPRLKCIELVTTRKVADCLLCGEIEGVSRGLVVR